MNPNPQNYDSDIDYWDACHPFEAAFEKWTDAGNHVDFLECRIAEVQEYVCDDNELDGMLFAMAVILIRMVPTFRPLLLQSFARQVDGIDNEIIYEELQNDVDTRPLIELFLFADPEARNTWPAVIKESASIFFDAFWEKVEKSEWLKVLWSAANELAAEMAAESEAERRAEARWGI